MNFEFTLNVESPVSTNNAQTSDRPQVDWAARTKYIVENSGTAKKAETEIFIITGVIDLGLHIQEDAKMEFKGTEEDEAAELAKNPNQYFETLLNDKKVPTRYKRWKITKPQQMIALTVDNPKRLLDIGQFHGDESGKVRPLRMLLNNEFYQKGVGKIVNKMGYSTKEVKNDDGTWSFKNNTTLYKLAKAVDVLDDKGHFKPAHVGKLIGKPILCEYQVFATKVGDKEYLNEKISFKGEVPSMMKDFIPELDSSHFFGVNFKGEQNLDLLKDNHTIRESVVNTMKNAINFEGSDVQKALIELGRVKASDSSQNQQEQAIPRPTAPKEMRKAEPSPTPQDIDFDDPESLPF